MMEQATRLSEGWQATTEAYHQKELLESYHLGGHVLAFRGL